MPYCTIEEAWGDGFKLNSGNEPEKFKKIVPDIAHSLEKDYYNLEEPIMKKRKRRRKRRVKKRKTFSRSYNKLDEHNGPESRLPPGDRVNLDEGYKKHKSFKPSNKEPEPYNMDTVVNRYDIKLESEMNETGGDETDGNESEFTESEFEEVPESNDVSDSDNLGLKEHFQNKEEYINYLVGENKDLKDTLDKLKNITDNNSNIFDLVLFISCGIFLIFLLDIISKGIRRF